MKKKIEELKEEIERKFTLINEYAYKEERIAKKRIRYLKEISELYQKMEHIKKSEEEVIKVYRIVPSLTTCLYIYLFKSEKEYPHYANSLFYEDMDEKFKEIIPAHRFTHAFVQPDLEYLYWTSPSGEIVKRKANELL